MTHELHLSIIQWSSSANVVVTKFQEDLRDRFGRPLESGKVLVRVDEAHGRYISFMLTQGLIKIMTVQVVRGEVKFGALVNERIEELKVLDYYITSGKEQQQVLSSLGTSRWNVGVVFEDIQGSVKFRVYSTNSGKIVDHPAFRDGKILTLSSPGAYEHMAVIVKTCLISDSVSLVFFIDKIFMINYCSIADVKVIFRKFRGSSFLGSPITWSRMHDSINASIFECERLLQADDLGNLNLIQFTKLANVADSKHCSDFVVERLGGVESLPTSVCYLGQGNVFIGSSRGDHFYLTLTEQASEVITDENSLTLRNYFKIQERIQNLGPLIDLVVDHGGSASPSRPLSAAESVISGGVVSIIVACGAKSDGSLALLCNSITVADVCRVDCPWSDVLAGTEPYEAEAKRLKIASSSSSMLSFKRLFALNDAILCSTIAATMILDRSSGNFNPTLTRSIFDPNEVVFEAVEVNSCYYLITNRKLIKLSRKFEKLQEVSFDSVSVKADIGVNGMAVLHENRLLQFYDLNFQSLWSCDLSIVAGDYQASALCVDGASVLISSWNFPSEIVSISCVDGSISFCKFQVGSFDENESIVVRDMKIVHSKFLLCSCLDGSLMSAIRTDEPLPYKPVCASPPSTIRGSIDIDSCCLFDHWNRLVKLKGQNVCRLTSATNLTLNFAVYRDRVYLISLLNRQLSLKLLEMNCHSPVEYSSMDLANSGTSSDDGKHAAIKENVDFISSLCCTSDGQIMLAKSNYFICGKLEMGSALQRSNLSSLWKKFRLGKSVVRLSIVRDMLVVLCESSLSIFALPLTTHKPNSAKLAPDYEHVFPKEQRGTCMEIVDSQYIVVSVICCANSGTAGDDRDSSMLYVFWLDYGATNTSSSSSFSAVGTADASIIHTRSNAVKIALQPARMKFERSCWTMLAISSNIVLISIGPQIIPFLLERLSEVPSAVDNPPSAATADSTAPLAPAGDVLFRPLYEGMVYGQILPLFMERPSPEKILVGDLMKSVNMYILDLEILRSLADKSISKSAGSAKNLLKEVARDFDSKWITALCPISLGNDDVPSDSDNRSAAPLYLASDHSYSLHLLSPLNTRFEGVVEHRSSTSQTNELKSVFTHKLDGQQIVKIFPTLNAGNVYLKALDNSNVKTLYMLSSQGSILCVTFSPDADNLNELCSLYDDLTKTHRLLGNATEGAAIKSLDATAPSPIIRWINGDFLNLHPSKLSSYSDLVDDFTFLSLRHLC